MNSVSDNLFITARYGYTVRLAPCWQSYWMAPLITLNA